MNVVIYTRVSTEDQKENGFSLQDQERRIRLHCKQYDKNILRHYQDDHSAKDFNRPNFQKFLDDLKSKRIKPQQFIVVRWDRFSRNLSESLSMKAFLKSYNVEIFPLENNYDESIPENLVPLMLQMVLPQVENERRGLNTKQGMRQAMRQGKWMWKAPKGYLNDKNGLIIKSAESNYIAKAFEEVAAGVNSVDSIRKKLNLDGFKVSKQQFLNLLKNPFYKGYFRLLAWRDEKEEIIRGLHEPIVDDELFNRVQSILESKGKRQTKTACYTSLFPLRGHLICNKCGSKLTASSSKGRVKKYPYYHCQKGCKERFDAELANRSILNYLSSFVVKEEVAELYLEILRDEFDTNEGSKAQQINLLQSQVSEFQRRCNSLDDEYSNGKLPAEHYLRLLHKNNKKIDELENEISAMIASPTRFDKHLQFGISLIRNLTYYYESAPIELKHKLLGSIFSNNLIFDGCSYRTEKRNVILDLVCSESIDYRGNIKEKTSFSRGQSNWAPPGVLFSNQLRDDLARVIELQSFIDVTVETEPRNNSKIFKGFLASIDLNQ
jgi:site-specific DNA recombinase